MNLFFEFFLNIKIISINITTTKQEFGLIPVSEPWAVGYDGIVLAVAHRQFAEMGREGIGGLGAKTIRTLRLEAPVAPRGE